LTYMLVLSPEYGPKFQQLVAIADARTPGEAFEKVYSKSLQDVEKDLRAWLAKGGTVTKSARMAAAENAAVRVSVISPTASQAMLAELLLASGQLDRAEELYRDLAQEASGSGDFLAALAIIAVKRGDTERGRQLWRKAMASEVSDAMLCYQYATLDGNAGVPVGEIRAVLERAVSLKPDFDDARYLLALNEQNSGDFEETVTQLQALKTIPPKRAFQYWSALAYALDAIGKHEEAKQAAGRAKEFATSEVERAHAARMAYMADTELAVQFTEDSNGHKQAVTTRVPRGTVNHNPFIEPGDQIRQARGQLKEIECSGQITGIVVDAPEGTIQLTIPNPQQVQILNGPSEFQCGAQSPVSVVVSYALAAARNGSSHGVVRGIEFQ
jgi:tetratricopeptide (TPR) repeat protein